VAFGADVIEGSELQGLGVVAVAPGSAADKAGIRIGDVVSQFSERRVFRSEELRAAIEGTARGSRVPVKLRRNGSEVAATVQF
jgi:putative serine protease PepD